MELLDIVLFINKMELVRNVLIIKKLGLLELYYFLKKFKWNVWYALCFSKVQGAVNHVSILLWHSLFSGNILIKRGSGSGSVCVCVGGGRVLIFQC